MTQKEFNQLKVGDLIRHESGDAWIIVEEDFDAVSSYRSYKVIRLMEASNPPEWTRVHL